MKCHTPLISNRRPKPSRGALFFSGSPNKAFFFPKHSFVGPLGRGALTRPMARPLARMSAFAQAYTRYERVDPCAVYGRNMCASPKAPSLLERLFRFISAFATFAAGLNRVFAGFTLGLGLASIGLVLFRVDLFLLWVGSGINWILYYWCFLFR